jgi:putative transposase
VVTLSGRRQAAAELVRQFAISERRACRVLGLHRSSYRYRRRERVSEAVYGAVIRKSEKHNYWGYRKIHDLVVGDGLAVGRERVRVIRRREGLQLRRKAHKRRVLGASTELVPRALYPNHVWSYDFVFDGTEDGRTLKFLTVVEEFTRLDLDLPCRRGFTSGDVMRVLEELMELWGRPSCIRSDNDSTFVARSVQRWLEDRVVGTHFIDPGSPWQNPYNESFNGIFRTTCLNRWSFASLTEARVVTQAWQHEYNSIRPHGSLGGRSPLQFFYDWCAEHPEIHTTMKIPESLT